MARDDEAGESVRAYRLEDDGRIPNNPDLPLLVYPGAMEPSRDLASEMERAFARNGWSKAWRNGVYDFHHYHSGAHEVLGVFQGHARLELGGAKGVVVEAAPGDVIVLPAGVGHRCAQASPDFQVVGATAHGRSWDICRGEPGERPDALARIQAVPLPVSDPVFGPGGPLVRFWRKGHDQGG